MKRALPLLFLAVTAFAQTAKSPKPLTNADVIEMSRQGVPESTIVLAIMNTPANFDVSADGILALHAGGITVPVLTPGIGRGKTVSRTSKYAGSP